MDSVPASRYYVETSFRQYLRDQNIDLVVENQPNIYETLLDNKITPLWDAARIMR